jgi:hypothetical protein
MDAATRSLVRERAGGRCEYCGLPQAAVPLATFHVEHITARQHGGSDDLSNLALSCHHCNLHKGPNIAGFDPETGQLSTLFDPRQNSWPDHFVLRGIIIDGRTPIGRTTVRVLAMNSAEQLETRFDLA